MINIVMLQFKWANLWGKEPRVVFLGCDFSWKLSFGWQLWLHVIRIVDLIVDVLTHIHVEACVEEGTITQVLYNRQERGYNTLVDKSLAPGSEYDCKNVFFNLDLLIGIFRSPYENALQWMPQGLADDKWTLVQVMAWCHQATSHYLSQCWLSSLSTYGVARPQWVNGTTVLVPYLWVTSLQLIGR